MPDKGGMVLNESIPMVISIRSFTDPDVTYRIDRRTGTCTCPAYSEGKGCEHLEAVGVFKRRRVLLSSRPSFSQALSGLVKGIRLRNQFEAAYWLSYCWQFRSKLPGSQFRTIRRLLIGSAEDGHSVAVMERVADAFSPLLLKDADLEDAIAELIRICKVPNWWHPDSGGSDYIYAGMVADRRIRYDHVARNAEECLWRMEEAIERSDRTEALFWVMKVGQLAEKRASAVAERLLQIALRRSNVAVTRILRNVYFRHARSLTADSNFTCQAAWLLAGGASPLIDCLEPVTPQESRMLLDAVLAAPAHVIPEWCCDGIHCAGNDVRYAGMWDRMYAVCRQYQHYQRVSTSDQWKEDDFYSMDGLVVDVSH